MNKNEQEILDELRQIAPNLSKIKKQDPFRVPVNYFEQLPHKIQEKAIQAESSPSIWQILVQYLVTPKYSLAAASVLVLLVGGLLYFSTSQKMDEFQFDKIAFEDIDNFIFENIDEFDTQLVEEGFLASATMEDLLMYGTDQDLDAIDDFLINDIEAIILEEELL